MARDFLLNKVKLFKHWRFYILGLIGLCTLFVSIRCYLFLKLDKFSIKHIAGVLPDTPPYPSQDPSFFLSSQFSEDFTYLGKGMQCFVFESKDHSLVIKFFRFERYQLPKWLDSLPYPPFLKKIHGERVALKKIKLQNLTKSCLLASQDLKEETGLLYLHLHPTSEIKRKINIIDRLGRSHQVDLDQTVFLVQKKADSFFPSLKQKNHRSGSRGI